MSFYEVKVVNSAGSVLQTFEVATGGGNARQVATIDEVNWVLNEPGMAIIRLPLWAAETTAIQVLKREVQIWRNGSIVFWGVPVQREVDGGSAVYLCPGIGWYYTRLFFGPVSTNYLLNPLFTANLSSWTAVGATATWASNLRLRGPGTVKLVSAASGDNYLQQQFQVTTGSIPLYLTAAALYWIDPGVAYLEPAFEERGLYIQSSADVAGPGGRWEPLTMNADIGKVEPVEVGISLAANTTSTVTVRLYSPRGTIHWGAASVTALESVSTQLDGSTDVTETMRRIMVYAETKFGHNILTNTPASGVKEIIAYQFIDAGNIYNALAEYPKRGVADFEFVITSTTRTFTTYSPRKGVHRPSHTLTIPGRGVIAGGHSLDGQQTATRVIRRSGSSTQAFSGTGSFSGSARAYAVAVDAAALDGLILENIEDAPKETHLDALDQMALVDLARLKQLVALPTATRAAEGWIGQVTTGDTVPVSFGWGAADDFSTRRVRSIKLRPADDTVEIGMEVPL